MWQLQEAKAKFSEVVDRAQTEGPQVISRHGKERAVVISIEEYRELSRRRPDFKQHLLEGPVVYDLDEAIGRSKDTGRDIEL